VFFDLDRTLWDFERNSKSTLEEIYSTYKLDQHISHFNHFHQSYLRINSDLWQKYGKKKITKNELRDTRFLKTLHHHEIYDESLASKLSEAYISISPQKTSLFPNTIQTLQTLKERDYQLHIITNGFVEVQYIKLENSNLRPFFDVVVCSEEIGVNKPNKEIFSHALNLANANASESMMIGDDLKVDIIGANQLGIEAVLFDPEKRHRSQAFQIINSLDEILHLLP
jgi:putative hydrolase of the HAD superfamily